VAVSGVGVLDKAAAIFRALESGPCSLAALAEATGTPRATAHRLAVALERHGLVERDGAGWFVLGPRLAALGRAADRGHRGLIDAATPALAELRDRSGESTQLYVPSGGRRICVVSLESPHSLRTIVAIGASLPVDRGSAGKVLRCEPEVLRRGWAESVEEREPGVASVSAPVLVAGEVVAAVSVSGPIGRTSRHPGRRYAAAVVDAARAVERRLALSEGRPSEGRGAGTWGSGTEEK
jgi:DNA-binding IclR family transcriptional regulator